VPGAFFILLTKVVCTLLLFAHYSFVAHGSQVCFEAPPEEPILTPCGHCFCRACVATMAQCPVCRAPLGDHDTTLVAITVPAEEVPSLDVLEKSGKWRTSSKLAAVLDELQRGLFGAAAQARGAGGKAGAERAFFHSAAARAPPDEGRCGGARASSAPRAPAAAHAKAVVFSQFAFMLDMVELTLRGASPPIGCVRLDGAMSQRQRESAIRRFKTDSEVRVFVVSLKAGGLGLNLTAASLVILCDPWWNPSVEEQAIDRCHRLGQTRAVEVVRLVVRDSVSFQLCTVTFYANLAHSLTRSP
jgi:hypothetical protein